MKLYYHPASPNGRRAILTLRQVGLQAEEVVVDFQRGDLSTPEFAKLNPNQKIPVLVEDDFVLWESSAIMQYLANKKPEAGLWPSEPRQQADVLRWMAWSLAHFAPAVGTYNWENLLKGFFTGGEPDAALLARAETDVARFGAVLDARLRDHAYVCGDTLTIADLTLACALMYREAAQVPIADFPGVRRWIESIEALDAWKSTQPKRG